MFYAGFLSYRHGFFRVALITNKANDEARPVHNHTANVPIPYTPQFSLYTCTSSLQACSQPALSDCAHTCLVAGLQGCDRKEVCACVAGKVGMRCEIYEARRQSGPTQGALPTRL